MPYPKRNVINYAHHIGVILTIVKSEISYGRYTEPNLNSTLRQSPFTRLQKTQLSRDKAACNLRYLSACKVGDVILKFIYFKSSQRNFSDIMLYRSILNVEIKGKP